MKKDILQDIIANKRIEVARQKQAVSLQTLLALGSDRMERDTRSMRAAMESSPSGIISEFKRKSPSTGWLHPGANIAEDVYKRQTLYNRTRLTARLDIQLHRLDHILRA